MVATETGNWSRGQAVLPSSGGEGSFWAMHGHSDQASLMLIEEMQPRGKQGRVAN